MAEVSLKNVVKRYGALEAQAHASKPARRICLSDEAMMQAASYKIDIQALARVAIFTQSVAPKIFEIYAPAFFLGRIGCEVVLGYRRSLANARDILLNLKRQVVDVMGVPWIVLAPRTASFLRKQVVP